MGLPGWGVVAGKIASWFPSPRQSKLNNIDKLLRENEKLQKEYPMSAVTASRIIDNADRIKQLRQEYERID